MIAIPPSWITVSSSLKTIIPKRDAVTGSTIATIDAEVGDVPFKPVTYKKNDKPAPNIPKVIIHSKSGELRTAAASF